MSHAQRIIELVAAGVGAPKENMVSSYKCLVELDRDGLVEIADMTPQHAAIDCEEMVALAEFTCQAANARITIALAAEGMELLAKLPIPTGPDVCGEEAWPVWQRLDALLARWEATQ